LIKDPRIQVPREEVVAASLADDLLSLELDADGTCRRAPTPIGIDTHLNLQHRAQQRSTR